MKTLAQQQAVKPSLQLNNLYSDNAYCRSSTHNKNVTYTKSSTNLIFNYSTVNDVAIPPIIPQSQLIIAGVKPHKKITTAKVLKATETNTKAVSSKFQPNKATENAFFGNVINLESITSSISEIENISQSNFAAINWLNTPGPAYTTTTEKDRIGPLLAITNIGSDEDFAEIIFKQPLNIKEAEKIVIGASIGSFDGYYFDGNKNWNARKIIAWWMNSEKRLQYIITLYKKELNSNSIQILDNDTQRSMPDNYKNWLDFYQYGMKAYLEWYIFKLEKSIVVLPEIPFNWQEKARLDDIFYNRLPLRLKLVTPTFKNRIEIHCAKEL